MTNEKQNEGAHWINKLNELDSLPEAISNKDAVWEKLHGRLQKKPRRNKPVWYLAAACLLPLFILLWISTNKKQSLVVNNIKNTSQKKIIPAPPLPITQKETVVAVAEKKPVINNIETPPKSMNTAKQIHTKISEPLIVNEIKPDEAITILQPADTATYIAAPLVVKKKLTVVHINELDIVPQQLASLHSNVQSSFRLVLGKMDANNTIAPPRQEYAGILKIPLAN